jgi:isopenicillin N synthase-like dioxygenase
MAADIPVIDLALWRSGSARERADVLAAVDHALTTSGFMLIVGHGIDGVVADNVRTRCRSFFDLDDAVKRPYVGAPGLPGWLPLGGEANAYASGEESPPDLKESLYFGPNTPGAQTISAAGLIPCVNRFPTEIPGLEPAVEEFMSQSYALCIELLELVALALGAEGDTFTKHCHDAIYSLLVAFYPSREQAGPAAPGQYRIGPHTDFGTITVLDRHEAGSGLQVQTPSGDWVDAPYVPGSLTVNIGDLLHRWTGGRYLSNKHRVLAPSPEEATTERLSLVLFMEADAHAVVEPLPEPIGGPHRWPPVTVLEHVHQQMAAITVG